MQHNVTRHSKLLPPYPERGLAIRQDLLEALSDRSHRVLYLKAGPGTGKTATTSLFAVRAGRTAWYTLSPDDNELYAFVFRLQQSVCRVLPAFRFPIGLYPLFHTGMRVASGLLDEFLTACRRLPDAQRASELTMVLDGVSVLNDPDTIWFLRHLLQQAPDFVRFILIGQSEQLELAVLADLPDVQTLGDDAFRLRPEDMVRVLGYESALLRTIPDGHPVSVNACRLLLQQHQDHDLPDGVLPGGDDPFTGLEQTLSPSLRDFLVQVRILDEMDAVRCNAAAGIGNASVLLEFLTNNHYFMKKYPDNTYALYPPFRSYLLNRYPPETAEYERMADILLEMGHPRQAGDLAARAGNLALLERSLTRAGPDMLVDGSVHTLRDWLALLPDPPELPESCHMKAQMLLLEGRPETALPLVRKAITGFREQQNGEGLLGAVRCYLHIRQYGGIRLPPDDVAEEILDEISAVSPEAECLILADSLSFIPIACDHETLERRILERRETATGRLAQMYDWLMIDIHYHAGRFPDVVAAWEAARDLSEEDLDRLGKASLVYYVVRSLQNMDEWEQADALAAEIRIRPRSVPSLIPESWHAQVMQALLLLRRLKGQQAASAGAVADPAVMRELSDILDALTELSGHAARHMDRDPLFLGTTEVLWYLTDRVAAPKDPEETAEWIRRHRDNCLPEVYLTGLLEAAVVLLTLERTGEAEQLLEECFTHEADRHLPSVETVLYALRAAVAVRARQEAAAEEYTRRAVERAAATRFYTLFANRELFEPVIHIAVDANMVPAFTRQIIDRFDYRIKKVFVNCFGDFYAAPIKDRVNPIHFRTNKTRELLAFLLHNRRQPVTKSELATALFGDDSIRNNKLLDVTIYYLRSAFRALDLDNPVIYEDGGYYVFDNQIECGIGQAAAAVMAFRRFPSRQTAESVLEAIPDRYMKDIQSSWAEVQRDLYEELVRMARETVAMEDE